MKTGIETTTKFFPLAFLFYICSPTIEVNGIKYTKKWGTDFFSLAPSTYTVKIYFKYLFMSECGANSVTVDVKEGLTSKVSWYMPPMIFAKGTMTIS